MPILTTGAASFAFGSWLRRTCRPLVLRVRGSLVLPLTSQSQEPSPPFFRHWRQSAPRCTPMACVPAPGQLSYEHQHLLFIQTRPPTWGSWGKPSPCRWRVMGQAEPAPLLQPLRGCWCALNQPSYKCQSSPYSRTCLPARGSWGKLPPCRWGVRGECRGGLRGALRKSPWPHSARKVKKELRLAALRSKL